MIYDVMERVEPLRASRQRPRRSSTIHSEARLQHWEAIDSALVVALWNGLWEEYTIR